MMWKGEESRPGDLGWNRGDAELKAPSSFGLLLNRGEVSLVEREELCLLLPPPPKLGR
jgi:hypothetical protein